ncbi:MAG: hypothetical protein HMLKMBBP_01697 [Planctomycetes bacterium]|nr:hypothetical protein [Planctomycetota bacterium]
MTRRMSSVRVSAARAFTAAAGRLAACAAVFACAAALFATPADAAERAAAVRGAGNATAGPAGQQKKVGAGASVKAGEVVVLAGAADSATIDFGGGASVSLVGPATLRIVEISDVGIRVRLENGAASQAVAGPIAMEVQTPAGPSLVLQNATGFARMAPQDKVLFERRGGELAKVWDGARFEDLSGKPWVLNLRTGSATEAAPKSDAVRGKIVQLPGDRARVLLGSRVITWEPASGFCPKEMPDGGIQLCFCAKNEEWGVVYVGTDTVLFLAKDQCVTFDANGNVTAFDGIVHVYHPLEENWDEPVENAADASVSYSSRR